MPSKRLIVRGPRLCWPGKSFAALRASATASPLRDGFSLVEALAAVALLALAALPLYDMAAALLRASDRLAEISAEIEAAGDVAAMRRAPPALEDRGITLARPDRSFQEGGIYAGRHLGFQLVEVELNAEIIEGALGERVHVHLIYTPRYDSIDQLLDENL